MTPETSQPAAIHPAVPQSRTPAYCRDGSGKCRIAVDAVSENAGDVTSQKTRKVPNSGPTPTTSPLARANSSRPDPANRMASTRSAANRRSTNCPTPSGITSDPIASVAKIQPRGRSPTPRSVKCTASSGQKQPCTAYTSAIIADSRAGAGAPRPRAGRGAAGSGGFNVRAPGARGVRPSARPAAPSAPRA